MLDCRFLIFVNCIKVALMNDPSQFWKDQGNLSLSIIRSNIICTIYEYYARKYKYIFTVIILFSNNV